MENAAFDLNQQPEGSVPLAGTELDMMAANMRARSFSTPRSAKPGTYGDPDMKGQNPDDGCIVEFYKHPISEQVICRMDFPGERFYKPEFPVDDQLKARFPRQWDAFVNGRSQIDGTPLLDAPFIPPAALDVLLHARIVTVEQLASVSDSGADGIPVLAHLRLRLPQVKPRGNAGR